jgi:long-subunit acyl-CoA synthetase (AMP-forming)
LYVYPNTHVNMYIRIRTHTHIRTNTHIRTHALICTHTYAGAVLYNGKVCSSKGVQVKLAPLPRMGADSSNTPTNSSSRAPTAPQEHEGGSLCSVGELWVKSPNLSLGYYGDPQATRESFRADGWYRTGDLAKYDSALDTYVILERVSAVRQRRDGSLVFPTRLEALYAHCPLVQQVLVHLDASSEVLTALVVPTTHTLGHTEDGSSREEEEEHTRERVLAEIVSLHASAGAAGDAPSRVVLAHAPFSQGNGLMTGTLKLRRVRIQERYADALATQQ